MSLEGTIEEEQMPVSSPNAHPLAQDFTRRYFFHDPNLTRLDDGTLLVAAPQWSRAGWNAGHRCLRILRSDDGGQTWQQLQTLPLEEGTPFVLDGQLLMFVQETSRRDFQIVSSDDGGRTWTPPKTVIEGPVWNISTARVALPETLYWAMDYDLPNQKHNGKVMVRLDRKMSPLDPKAWSLSNVVHPPELPAALTRNTGSDGPQSPGGSKGRYQWSEPNTVEVGGCIRAFVRCNSAPGPSIAHTAGVLDYDPQYHRLSFTQFSFWPGAQCKFFVIHDRPHAMYWMLSNLVTNSQDLLGWAERLGDTGFRGGPGNERRWLFLHYSIDCLNWFPAGCVARWPDSIVRSFMYPSAVIDGNDLVLLSRTSRDSGDQHDADLCTIHRVRNFRDLAMDLHKGGLHV